MCPCALQHAWVHRNQLYPGIYEALRACDLPWYIASSKAPQRVSPLLGSLLGVDLGADSPRLLAGLIPPTQRKIEALRWGAPCTAHGCFLLGKCFA